MGKGLVRKRLEGKLHFLYLKVLNHARNHSIDESLEFVKIWNMSQLQSKDLIESAMAAMNKKKATYEDL